MRYIFPILICLIFFPKLSAASPDLESVAAGSINLSQSASQTLIQQSTNRAVLNWHNFDVASDHEVVFRQPNSGSFTLNRVPSSFFPTFIDGHVTANGSIAIVNPQGIVIGPTGSIQSTNFMASTYDILDSDVMDTNSNLNFNISPFFNSTISHQGEIRVNEDGKILIHAPRVEILGGKIQGDHSLVALTSADSVSIDLSQGLNQLQLILSSGDIQIQNADIQTNHGDLVIATGNSLDIDQSLFNAGEGSIDFFTDGAMNIDDSLLQSSGNDIHLETTYGDLTLQNNVIVTSGGSFDGAVDMDAFNTAPYGFGSEEAFRFFAFNDVNDASGQGGDIVIRSSQIFGDNNCVQSGQVSCLYQGQAPVFSTDTRRIKNEKLLEQVVQSSRQNHQEKIVTLSKQTPSLMTTEFNPQDTASYLSIEGISSISDEE